MNYSAKHSLAIACCLSVCLSVCWKCWKLIAQTVSPTSSLFIAQRSSTYSQGNMEKFWGDLRWGWKKVACSGTKAAVSLKRIKIEEKLLWGAYRKSPMLFRFFGSPPYFYFRFRLYRHRVGRFCLIFAHTAQQLVLDGTNGLSSFKPCAYCQIVHRADIFAIAQLSCSLLPSPVLSFACGWVYSNECSKCNVVTDAYRLTAGVLLVPLMTEPSR